MNDYKPTALKWGVILGAFLIAFGVIGYLVDMSNESPAQYLIWGAVIAATVMAIKEFRTLNNERLTLKQGFMTGFLANLIFALIAGVWTFVFFEYVAPAKLDEIHQMMIDKMTKDGRVTEIEAEEALDKMKFMTSTYFFAIAGFFNFTFVGAVVSLISGAVMKKD